MFGVSIGNEVSGLEVKTGQEPVLGGEQWVGKQGVVGRQELGKLNSWEPQSTPHSVFLFFFFFST